MTYSIKINHEFKIFGIHIKFMLEIALNKTINETTDIPNKITEPLSHSSSFGLINNIMTK